MTVRSFAANFSQFALIAIIAALCTPVVSLAATFTNVYVENFQSYNPATDGLGSGSTNLGGQGQLEDITGSPWSGTDTDTPFLQTRITSAADQNLRLRTDQTATIAGHRLITSAVFSPVTQDDAFRLSFNLEGYSSLNTGSGRFQVGLRNSTSDLNVLGIEMQSSDGTELRAHGHQWSGGNEAANHLPQLATMPANVTAADVGSIELLFDPLTSEMTINAYDGADLTGSILESASGIVTIGPFSADSVFLQATQGNISQSRISDVNIDDITVAVQQQQQAVPEPTAILIWSIVGGMCAAGVYWQRKRKRRADSPKRCNSLTESTNPGVRRLEH